MDYSDASDVRAVTLWSVPVFGMMVSAVLVTWPSKTQQTAILHHLLLSASLVEGCLSHAELSNG